MICTFLRHIKSGGFWFGGRAIFVFWKSSPGSDTRRGKDLMGTFLSDIVLHALSFVAGNERTNIKKRQEEGAAAAKAQGIKFGRLPLTDNFCEVHKAWRNKKMTLKQAAKAFNMPVGTFYGKARKLENAD